METNQKRMRSLSGSGKLCNTPGVSIVIAVHDYPGIGREAAILILAKRGFHVARHVHRPRYPESGSISSLPRSHIICWSGWLCSGEHIRISLVGTIPKLAEGRRPRGSRSIRAQGSATSRLPQYGIVWLFQLHFAFCKEFEEVFGKFSQLLDIGVLPSMF